MTLVGLVREAWAGAWTSRVSSLLVGLLVAGTVATILLTVGRSAAAEDQVRRDLDQAGARLLVVNDLRGVGFINPGTTEVVGGLSSVESVVADGLPTDTRNGAVGAGGDPVPTWPVVSGLPEAVDLQRGRWPGVGEALVSVETQQTLGLVEPVGFLTDGRRSYPVVGSYRARPAFAGYAAGAVVADPDAAARRLQVVVTSAGAAADTRAAVLGVLDPADPESVAVSSPGGFADAAAAVGGTVARYGRAVLALLLVAGAGAVGVVVGCDVMIRRRDLGRRRTLGISRADLVTLVLLRCGLPAGAGAVLGALGGQLGASFRAGATAGPAFAVATMLLTVLVSMVAAVPPAVLAAWRDPVSVLRSP